MWLLGGWEPRLHRLPWRVCSELDEAACGPPRAVAQDEAPLRGREEPGGDLTARHAGKATCVERARPLERRRLQHGSGSSTFALPGALLLLLFLLFLLFVVIKQLKNSVANTAGAPPARAPLPAPGALGLLPRASGATGAARTLAGGHGTVRAPGLGLYSLATRPPGF